MITVGLLLSAGGLAFAPPAPIMALGRVINVDIGHAAPVYTDVTGDRIPDLIVGQFHEGKARIYKNGGTATAPSFKEFTYLQAGGKTATVDYG
jgi:hypothetical protein